MFRALLCPAAFLALCLGSLPAAEDNKDEKNLDKKPTSQETRRRPSDVVFILIETSDVDEDSTAELQRIYDVLRKLDKNKDGKIDPEELKVVREKLIDERVDHILSKLDADKDGRISKDEAKGRIKEHFDRLDLDKDGYISRDELRQAITSRSRSSGKDDPNKDK
jgi:Ca2+-binding EF-hand superfamily protein